MTDDIVTRLRNECQCSDNCRTANDPCIPIQAVDEIERLRNIEHQQLDIIQNLVVESSKDLQNFNSITNDRDRWREIADGLYSWAIGILGDHMTIEPVKQYEKAVRGE
jgi:hypothetical protein